MHRLLDSTEWAYMCAGSAIPALHLPDHQLVTIEHLVQLLKVCAPTNTNTQIQIQCTNTNEL